MAHKVNIEGFEGQDIEASVSFWTGPKLLVNGEKARKGPGKRQMLLQRNDGQDVIASWKLMFFGFDIPQLVVDGKTIEIVKPLLWYQWLVAALPLFTLFLGGAIGYVLALVGLFINLSIFRSQLKEALKYIVTLAITLTFFFGYLIFSFLLAYLIYR